MGFVGALEHRGQHRQLWRQTLWLGAGRFRIVFSALRPGLDPAGDVVVASFHGLLAAALAVPRTPVFHRPGESFEVPFLGCAPAHLFAPRAASLASPAQYVEVPFESSALTGELVPCSSQGQPWARSHRSTCRRPPLVAAVHERLPMGNPGNRGLREHARTQEAAEGSQLFEKSVPPVPHRDLTPIARGRGAEFRPKRVHQPFRQIPKMEHLAVSEEMGPALSPVGDLKPCLSKGSRRARHG